MACNDEERLHARERRDDVFDDAVGEVFLLRISAHIGEGKYRNRRKRCNRRVCRQCELRLTGRCAGARILRINAERAHRVGDVLHLLFALIDESRSHLATDSTLYRVRDRDSARLGQPLQPGCDIDAVAVNCAVGFFHDVTEMDTDAKAHFAVFGDVFRHSGEDFLYRKRGGNRAGRSFEYREHRISRHIDDPALVGIDMFAKRGARGIERSYGCPFASSHQARIAGHVGSKNRCESLFDRRLTQ
jgi:hypothetical protein